MKTMKHLLRPIALSLVWVLVELSCKNETVIQQEQQSTVVKEPNQKGCSDGTCCDRSPKVIFEYNETLVGEPVVLGGPPYNSSWGLGFGRQVPTVGVKPLYNRTAVICELSYDKVERLPISPVVIARDTTFKPDYRVWGRIYTGANITVIGREPVRFVYVDRIERLK